MPLKQPARAGFSKADRLLTTADFARVRSGGKRFFSKRFTVFILPNGLHRNRLGVTVSARVGKAIKRNRIKRLLREFFRLNRERISPETPVDIMISVKKGAEVKDLSSLEEELLRVFDEKPRHAKRPRDSGNA